MDWPVSENILSFSSYLKTKQNNQLLDPPLKESLYRLYSLKFIIPITQQSSPNDIIY